MIKLLITGFQHSGTTLLMQLIKAHPQVGYIENEECYIEYDKPKEWVLMFAKEHAGNLKENVWGEKIPWGNRYNDKGGKRPISIIKKWFEYFHNSSRILQIVRHPFDVVLSGNHSDTITEDYLSFVLDSVSNVINFMNCHKNCGSIIYEDLVIDPRRYLKKIFTFLNLDVNDKIITDIINIQSLKFNEINADRAFAFMRKGIKRNIDYDEIINSIEVRL